MRTEFLREAILTKRAPLLMTAAVPIGKERVDKGYDVSKVSRYSIPLPFQCHYVILGIDENYFLNDSTPTREQTCIMF